MKVAIHINNPLNLSFNICTPETINRKINENEINEMKDILNKRIPLLFNGKLLNTVTCMYTTTPDEHL